MKLYSINSGYFKLDGGAMFGVVPKSIWNKLNPADDRNLCTWAMRCLLVESGNRLCLIDTGLGNKQSEKFFSYYEPSGPDLISSLQDAGFSADDITDVFLTHLHFDHCGGAVVRASDGSLKPQFKDATYYSHTDHWHSATHPNAREKASFLRENILPIEESGQLKLLSEPQEILPGFSFIVVNGHTDSMMLPLINQGDNTIVYMADLIPSSAHIPIPYVMAYDMNPLISMEEKEIILDGAANNDWILFFEHDPLIEACSVERTEKGIKIKNALTLSDI